MLRVFIPNRSHPAFVTLFLGLICLLPLSSPAIDTQSGVAPGSVRSDPAEQRDRQFEKAVGILNACLNREAEKILLNTVENDPANADKALFMLGILYREAGNIEEAERYFVRAARDYPLLRDYALKLLVELYMNTGTYEKAVETARQIQNTILLQYARKSEITALLALKREDQATEALAQYIERFPTEWDTKFTLALLWKARGETAQAGALLKNIYVNAVALSEDALRELKLMKSDVLSKEELLTRADSLYQKHNYPRAEATYKEVLGQMDESEKERIIFLIGMCQFRQKHYDESADTFGLMTNPEALYWQARSFYRSNERESFDRIKKEFEMRYPGNHQLALLFLMDADEFRRNGSFADAERNYKEVMERFPQNAEDALWGLGWMNYVNGNYKYAADYFSLLSTNDSSRDYYKYLFWRARSQEKLVEECKREDAEQTPESNNDSCNKEDKNFFEGLPSDESYYGYLIKVRSKSFNSSERVALAMPEKPEGEQYERIEVLSQLGLRDEAVGEILEALKNLRTRREFLYLGFMAMKLDEYRKVISYAEPKKDRELLPYSYPLGYWNTVEPAAASKNLDAHLIAALIREESRFDPTVISWAGAIGLMQLMPSTAHRLKDEIKISLEHSSHLQDPQKNILLGTHYLSHLMNEFKELPLAIAAYNAGENALKKWLERFNHVDLIEFIENIPYRETRRYVKKVLKSYWQYRTINGLPIRDDGTVFGG